MDLLSVKTSAVCNLHKSKFADIKLIYKLVQIISFPVKKRTSQRGPITASSYETAKTFNFTDGHLHCNRRIVGLGGRGNRSTIRCNYNYSAILDCQR